MSNRAQRGLQLSPTPELTQGIGSLGPTGRAAPDGLYAPARGRGPFDGYETGSDLLLAMMLNSWGPPEEGRDPYFDAQGGPKGPYGEWTLRETRHEVGAPERTEPGQEQFPGNRWNSPALDSANIRDLIELSEYLQGAPDEVLSDRDRALRDLIPSFLARRTGG